MSERLIQMRLVDRGPVAGLLRGRLKAPAGAVHEPDVLIPVRLAHGDPVLERRRRLQVSGVILFPLLPRLLPRLRRVHQMLPGAEKPRRRAPMRALSLHKRGLPRLAGHLQAELRVRQPPRRRVDLHHHIRDQLLPRHERLPQRRRHPAHRRTQASPGQGSGESRTSAGRGVERSASKVSSSSTASLPSSVRFARSSLFTAAVAKPAPSSRTRARL